MSGWEKSSPGVGRASTSAGCSQTPAASLTRHRIFVSVQSRVDSGYEGGEGIDIERSFTNPGHELQ